MPVLARGFADVNKRVEVQEKATKEQEKAFEALKTRLENLKDRHYTSTAASIERLKAQGVELTRRVTMLMKQVCSLSGSAFLASLLTAFFFG